MDAEDILSEEFRETGFDVYLIVTTKWKTVGVSRVVKTLFAICPGCQVICFSRARVPPSLPRSSVFLRVLSLAAKLHDAIFKTCPTRHRARDPPLALEGARTRVRGPASIRHCVKVV